MIIEENNQLMLRPLERTDLHFVHSLNNNAKIMRYWFEEPYETFSELSQLYDRHVHDLRERRFVAVDKTGETVGLAELIELDTSIGAASSRSSLRPALKARGMQQAQPCSQRTMRFPYSICASFT